MRLLLEMMGAVGLVVTACGGEREVEPPDAAPSVASTAAPMTTGPTTTSSAPATAAPDSSSTPTTTVTIPSGTGTTSVLPGWPEPSGYDTPVDLGVLPDTSMAYALDLNDEGVVVGQGLLPVGGEAISVAVWWPAPASGPQRLDEELGFDQVAGSTALRVNDRGQILVAGGGGRVVVVDPVAGSMQEVLVPFAVSPPVLFEAGLNNAGDVVGSVVVNVVDTGEGQHAVTHAFRWSAAAQVAVDLGTLPGRESSHAYDINDEGQIVGDSDGRPFVWDPSTCVMTELDIAADPGSIHLMRINNSGLVLASPVVWDLRANMPVGGGPDLAIAAYDLNDAGVVAAVVTGSCPDCYGITWDPFTGATSELRAAAANPLAINNNGQVVGTSNARAALWNPTPQA